MRLELTRRADYAVRAMLALARLPSGGQRSAPWIAERMRIPPRFLPHIMADLVRAGLLTATAGRSGGYRLARSIDDISILEIIEATEGDSRRRTCILRGIPCGPDDPCDIHDVFADAQEELLARLSGASLAEIVRRGRERIGVSG